MTPPKDPAQRDAGSQKVEHVKRSAIRQNFRLQVAPKSERLALRSWRQSGFPREISQRRPLRSGEIETVANATVGQLRMMNQEQAQTTIGSPRRELTDKLRILERIPLLIRIGADGRPVGIIQAKLPQIRGKVLGMGQQLIKQGAVQPGCLVVERYEPQGDHHRD